MVNGGINDILIRELRIEESDGAADLIRKTLVWERDFGTIFRFLLHPASISSILSVSLLFASLIPVANKRFILKDWGFRFFKCFAATTITLGSLIRINVVRWRNKYLKLSNDMSDIYGHYIQKDPSHTFLVAVDSSNSMLGCVGLDRYVNDKSMKTAEVRRMMVRRDMQGKGLAKRLMARIVEEGVKRGYDQLLLDTTHYQPAAQAVYRGAGFKLVQDTEILLNASPLSPFVSIPVPLLIYTRPLKANHMSGRF
mmetsp:Transcript_11051/g.11063  ORF Transcript_11051/g.11063 Transcript_11051/m.11063 type:complete len:254 (-) Transcript_11051:50-811(-)